LQIGRDADVDDLHAVLEGIDIGSISVSMPGPKDRGSGPWMSAYVVRPSSEMKPSSPVVW